MALVHSSVYRPLPYTPARFWFRKVAGTRIGNDPPPIMRQQIEIHATCPPLLGPGEPPAWELRNHDSDSPLVILCDHAHNRIPDALGQLGLDPVHLGDHIAYDIGALAVADRLADAFPCRMFAAGYSRLVIDLNRHPGDGSSIPEVSDQVTIPGNRDLHPDQVMQRENELFWPYHNAVTSGLEQIRESGRTPVILSLHSFTPSFRGFERPWHLGVLWDRDQRLSGPLIHRLSRLPGICVGDNQPYHARNPLGFTMDVHCERNGYPHVLLEIRQDLIGDARGAAHWARLLHSQLRPLLIELALLEIEP